MIFDCPNCDAENGVPDSTINNDGCLLKCRQCLETFRVFPPDEEELSKEKEPVLDLAKRASMAWAMDDGPNTRIDPIPTEGKLRGAELNDLEGKIQETDEIQLNAILSVDSDPLLRAPSTRGVLTDDAPSASFSEDRDLDSEEAAASLRADERAVIESYGMYEDPSEISMSGLAFMTENSAWVSSAVGKKAFNDSPRFDSANPLQKFRSVNYLWSNAPLSLKTALGVFPVAFIVGLVFGSPADVASPSDALAAKLASTEKSPKGPVVIPVKPDQELAETISDKSDLAQTPVRFPSDHLAPDNHAFIQPQRLRVRSRPQKASRIAGTLRSGNLIRVYDRYEDWSLIFLPSGGPVGFVQSKYLGPRRPESVLAKELSFKPCSARTSGSIGACMESARAQERECLVPCGSVDDASELAQRCHKICSLAFESCADSCRVKRKRSRKRKRRKAR